MTNDDLYRNGPSIPKELSDLLGDKRITESLPIRFSFKDKEFVLEIMLFLDINDPSNYDHENNRVRFARNGEGFVLLVDLSGEEFEILQEEFGNIDFIGVTLNDLNNADWITI